MKVIENEKKKPFPLFISSLFMEPPPHFGGSFYVTSRCRVLISRLNNSRFKITKIISYDQSECKQGDVAYLLETMNQAMLEMLGPDRMVIQNPKYNRTLIYFRI